MKFGKYKFELKNIKHSEFASHETHCYEATLYVNGKRFCKVGNDGYGGSDNYWPLNNKVTNAQMWAYVKEVNDYLKQFKCEGAFSDLSYNLEIICGELVNSWLEDKEVKKALKSILYIKPQDNSIWKVKLAPSEYSFTRVKEQKWWQDDYVILNELPFEQAKAEIIKREA